MQALPSLQSDNIRNHLILFAKMRGFLPAEEDAGKKKNILSSLAQKEN